MFKAILSAAAAALVITITIVVAVPEVASAVAVDTLAPTVSPIAVVHVPTTSTMAATQYNYYFPTDEPSSNDSAAIMMMMDHDHNVMSVARLASTIDIATTPAAMGATVQ
jgi:hypothetical protein